MTDVWSGWRLAEDAGELAAECAAMETEIGRLQEAVDTLNTEIKRRVRESAKLRRVVACIENATDVRGLREMAKSGGTYLIRAVHCGELADALSALRSEEEGSDG